MCRGVIHRSRRRVMAKKRGIVNACSGGVRVRQQLRTAASSSQMIEPELTNTGPELLSARISRCSGAEKVLSPVNMGLPPWSGSWAWSWAQDPQDKPSPCSFLLLLSNPRFLCSLCCLNVTSRLSITGCLATAAAATATKSG